MRRRGVVAGLLAAPLVARAQGVGRVVVVGGGFGGATAARGLAKAGHRVTLIDQDPGYVAAPLSNDVLVGLREPGQQQFGWDALKAVGIKVVQGRVGTIDSALRRVDAGEAGVFEYDRLVLAPGVELKLDGTLPGYDQAATVRMPHAWKAGIQTIVLREQIREMADGGTVVISVPAGPFKGPASPYERASLIAWYLKANKPRSKVLILDAQETFSQQALFEQAWAALYPGMVRRVGPGDGGRVVSVDPEAMTLRTDRATWTAEVANVIPPQQAGVVAQAAGVADRSGWCPVDPVSFESQRVARIHVIGDAMLGGMAKTAFGAVVQGMACADAVAALLAGQVPARHKLINSFYSVAAPGYGFSSVGVFQVVSGQWMPVEGAGGTSALDAGGAVRAREASDAEAWFRAATGAVFG